MSTRDYAALPEELRLREVKVGKKALVTTAQQVAVAHARLHGGHCSISSASLALKANLIGPEITHLYCQSRWREWMIILYSPGVTALGTRSAGLLRSSHQLSPIACAAGGVPAAIHRESAQAAEGSPTRTSEPAQDDPPGLHDLMLRPEHRESSHARDFPPSARRDRSRASQAAPGRPRLRSAASSHSATAASEEKISRARLRTRTIL